MPVQAPFPKNPQPPQPNATIGDAINYVSSNPGGVTYVVNAVKWLIGLVGAFHKPPIR
jgi:hypothetical protein